MSKPDQSRKRRKTWVKSKSPLRRWNQKKQEEELRKEEEEDGDSDKDDNDDDNDDDDKDNDDVNDDDADDNDGGAEIEGLKNLLWRFSLLQKNIIFGERKTWVKN